MPSNLHQQGKLIQADYLQHIGGINLTDSAFAVKDTQCLEGYNFDYISTGGFRKRKGMASLFSSADTQLKTLGQNMYVDSSGTKTLLRAAGTKIQTLNSTTYAPTDLTEDTAAAGSSFLDSSSTQPVVFSQFNNGSANTLWMTGGGLSTLTGMYSTSKVTTNGVPAPTGTISGAASGSGSSLSTGTYYYAAALYKASTGAISNAALDASVAVTSGQNVTVTLSTLTNPDSTKYTQIWVYRSSVNGVSAFTAGDLIAKVAAGTASYSDTGTSITSSTTVPRAANTLLDNSQLPSGTYTSVVTFKRRLITASGSNVYLSDLGKSESWPSGNVITVPSGGNITALAVIYFNTPTTSATDEYLIVFKESEMWVITGDALTVDSSNPGNAWKLKFIDSTGCPSQSLVVSANGTLTWLDYRGGYMWTGGGKPTYLTRLLEPMFQDGGDISKATLAQGVGVYYKPYNQIIWFLGHLTKGLQKFMLKLDLRLTIPQVQASLLTNSIVEGVFSFDYQNQAGIYSAVSLIPPGTKEESVFIGDDAGQIYKMYSGYQDAALTALDFNYKTRFLDCSNPGVTKRLHKVIVYVADIGDVDLTLNYWAQYRTSVSQQSTKTLTTPGNSTTAVWDQAVWDLASWDDFSPSIRTVTFNVSSENNNVEGDAFQLQFQQQDYNSPITIYGFSLIYSVLGTRH